MSYDIYKNMSEEDLYRLRDNKEAWGNASTPEEKQKLNEDNTSIRNKYNISEGQDVPLYTLNDYIKTYQQNKKKDGLLENITNPQMDKIDAAAEKVVNFKYNPNTDPMYKVYKDMYEKQSASAQKSTINELNSVNMGRNSSYSSAAAAQVAQAYNQKVSEMIPTLAEQAYNKLLQQYNITKDTEDTRYNRNLQAYNVLSNEETTQLQNKGYRLNNEAQEIQNSFLPEQLRIDIESGKLANEIATQQLTVAEIEAEIMRRYGLSNAEAQYVAQQIAIEGAKLDNQYRTKQIANYGVSGGGGGGSSDKTMNMINADEMISDWIYSNMGLDEDVYDAKYEGQPVQAAAWAKINDGAVLSKIKRDLANAGYSYAQINSKIEEYKENVYAQYVAIFGDK